MVGAEGVVAVTRQVRGAGVGVRFLWKLTVDNYVDRECTAGTEEACVAPLVAMAVDSTAVWRSDAMVGVIRLRGPGGYAPEEGNSGPLEVKCGLQVHRIVQFGVQNPQIVGLPAS